MIKTNIFPTITSLCLIACDGKKSTIRELDNHTQLVEKIFENDVYALSIKRDHFEDVAPLKEFIISKLKGNEMNEKNCFSRKNK